MQRKYHWISLKSDVRDYVLSCGCRRLKRSTSQRVAMLPPRFLKPWEVLEMDIHDMGARSEAGSKHLLVIVDRASKFLFVNPLLNKIAENVAEKLLEQLLTFGIPLSLRSDPSTEFTAEVVQHLCKWLNVTIDSSPTDHPRAQRAVEGVGGGSMKSSWNFARVGLGDGMNTCNRPSGCTGQPPTLRCQARPPPSVYYSAVTAVPRWALPHQAPATRAWTDCITSSPTRVKTFVKCRKFAKAYSTAMSRDASDENTTTQGSDAPLPEPE